MSSNQKLTQALSEAIGLRDAYNAGKLTLHQIVTALEYLDVQDHFIFDENHKCIMTHFTMGERNNVS